MNMHQYGEALPLFRQEIAADSQDWAALYMAGQCCRFENDLDGAVTYLVAATDLEPKEPPVYLALGIARQLRSEWDLAVDAFRKALEIDPDYALAFNSLAFTQKQRGEFAKASYNYDAGAEALVRKLVKCMRNSPANRIYKHRDTVGELWIRYALKGATYLAVIHNIDGVGWLTGQGAVEEEQTEAHAGQFWFDGRVDDGVTRCFLPNFFNTIREQLRRDLTYSTLIGNRGSVLELLGEHEEAERHFEEAREFAYAK